MPLVHHISRAWRQQHSQWAANGDARAGSAKGRVPAL